jgi:hypothetical protein
VLFRRRVESSREKQRDIFSVAGPNHRSCDMQIRPDLALVQPPQVPTLSSKILRPPQPMVLPHISVVGPVHRFFLHSTCKLLTAIGVIAERASVTDFNLAQPVAKAGHNVTTQTETKNELSDRMLLTDWRGASPKRRIETNLWLLSYPGSDRTNHRTVTMTPRTVCLINQDQSAPRVGEVMLRPKFQYCRLVLPANGNIWVLQAVCSSQTW